MPTNFHRAVPDLIRDLLQERGRSRLGAGTAYLRRCKDRVPAFQRRAGGHDHDGGKFEVFRQVARRTRLIPSQTLTTPSGAVSSLKAAAISARV